MASERYRSQEADYSKKGFISVTVWMGIGHPVSGGNAADILLGLVRAFIKIRCQVK